jgi:hypothetical protein
MMNIQGADSRRPPYFLHFARLGAPDAGVFPPEWPVIRSFQDAFDDVLIFS